MPPRPRPSSPSPSQPNPFLLAADHPDALLAHLRAHPTVATAQDNHGYSLLHAAASYNHLPLLRALVTDFHAPVALRDEDAETALFVVESVHAARLLVEELGLDASLRNDEGQTARERIEADGEFPAVAEYLRGREEGGAGARAQVNGTNAGANGVLVNGDGAGDSNGLPPVPQGLEIVLGTADEESGAPVPALRRRIEELAAREDFHTEAGQAELRRVVEEAVRGEELTEGRNVRPREG